MSQWKPLEGTRGSGGYVKLRFALDSLTVVKAAMTITQLAFQLFGGTFLGKSREPILASCEEYEQSFFYSTHNHFEVHPERCLIQDRVFPQQNSATHNFAR